MKALLLDADSVFELDHALPAQADLVAQDLEVGTLLEVMGGGDAFVRDVAWRALMLGVSNPDAIRYRQQVLSDCLSQPALVRQVYAHAVQGTEVRRDARFFWFRDSPDSLVKKSIGMLGALFEVLREVRELADQHHAEFHSPGFARLFASLSSELDDDYLAEVADRLAALRFRHGTLLSASLGRANRGADYVLREPEPQSFRNRLETSRSRNSFTIPQRDEHGIDALSELRSRGITLVGDALAQSTDHVLGFCHQLRSELAFYVACLNLYDGLTEKGLDTCIPDPVGREEPLVTETHGLYDPALAFHLDTPPAASDLDAHGQRLMVVTGANQGGKSTFLRSIGLAQLMLRAGMFVCATAYRGSLANDVYTHFKREEDPTMTRGKLEEELQRMREIIDQITPGGLLLCNESFASTNEREGSEIAHQVTSALAESGIRVVFVTHLYDFASSLQDDSSQAVLFLRAERLENGQRTFRIVPGAPLPTSYGRDSYHRIFEAGGSLSPALNNPPANQAS